MRLWSRFLCAFVAPLLLSLIIVNPAAAAGPRAWMLAGGSLRTVDTGGDPTNAAVSYVLQGLTPPYQLRAIDFRPQNGLLYALGYDVNTQSVRLFVISTRTGTPTGIGTTGTFVDALGTPVPIAVTANQAFGFNFDPVTDRIRVTTDTGQNFRIDPNTGAFVDGDLGGAPGSVTGLNMDAPIGGATTQVESIAYTNSQQNAGSSTLYTLDGPSHSLYIQAPGNSGTQTLVHTVTAGGNPLPIVTATGFDILPGTNTAYANLLNNGMWQLHTIDLTTGAAVAVGQAFLTGGPIALQSDGGTSGLPAIALAPANVLHRFNSASPAAAVAVPATGIVAGETLVGIDWRPQTGQLLGFGVNTANGTGSATLYRLDPQTGVATIMGTAASVANGAGTPIDLGGATAFGFDVDPVTDRVRVVANNGVNFRIDPNDGTIVGGALEGAINGGATGVSGAAYTRSTGQPLNTGTTALYTLDPATDRLFIQNPANAGTETAGVAVTLNGAPLDFSTAEFDIPAGTTTAAPSGVALAVLSVGGVSRLYTLNLTTGATTLAGQVGTQDTLLGLTVGEGAPLSSSVTLQASPNPVVIAQPLTLSAAVTPADATGTVSMAAANCNGLAIVGGAAACITSIGSTTFGFHGDSVTLTAFYSGDLDHVGSASTPVVEGITHLPVTITLSAAPNPAQAMWDDVVVGATLSGASIVSGTVTFLSDGQVLCPPQAPQSMSASCSAKTLPAGMHQIVATFSGNDVGAPSQSAPLTLVLTTPPPLKQYFAEGATGGFFQTDVGVLNASKTSPAHLTATLLPESGVPVVMNFTLDPLARRSLDLNQLLGSGQGVSTLIESDQPIAAMRQMSWGHPVYGSTLESGSPSAATTWYFAEGATNVFSLFYLVENPSTQPATVTLTHLLEGGAAPVIENEMVPAQSRRTFYINDIPGLRFAALSTVITADVPVVAERAMYLNATDRIWEGGAAGHGATELSKTWTFAEGATGFFHMYLLLGNPNVSEATVTIRYQFPDGSTFDKSYQVAGQSRRTVDVNNEDPTLASASIGATLTSTQPIVAERAMWWGMPFYEGSVALGSTSTGTIWGIGEAAEGGPNADATFVLVANATATNGSVRFTVSYDDGTTEQKDYTLLGNARLTVRIADDFVKSIDHRFSVLVESLTAGVSITVDCARYQSPVGFLDAGGAASATLIR